jgi:hypothetical protein
MIEIGNISLTLFANSTGLLLDIIGALILWLFGLPPDIRRSGQSYLVIGQGNEKEILKAKHYDSYSRCGIYLLLFGFVLQLISNFT